MRAGGEWTLMPPAPDVCQVCAVGHGPDEPHNAQSLYWAMRRVAEERPPPTWEEALAHCPVEMRDFWIGMLEEKGVVLNVERIEELLDRQEKP